MANENDLNFYILEAISASSSPIGAGTIRVYLKKQGILRSEAGVGRNLRELQIRCLVRKEGYQGHVLTKEGLKYLESLRKYRNQSKAARDLVTQINSVDEAMMDEIFHARRAIETEAARLAAERATEKQIAMVRENIKKRKKTIDQGQNDPDLDR